MRPLAATAASAVLSVMPGVAWAAGGSVNSIAGVISALQGWLLGILAALATLFLVLGGVRYLMAGGDPAEVEKAKSALRSAGIGYGLAVLAPSILAVLKSIVGGQ